MRRVGRGRGRGRGPGRTGTSTAGNGRHVDTTCRPPDGGRQMDFARGEFRRQGSRENVKRSQAQRREPKPAGPETIAQRLGRHISPLLHGSGGHRFHIIYFK